MVVDSVANATVVREDLVSDSAKRSLLRSIADQWQGSAAQEESTLHQIGPYIGKMKSSMARALVHAFTEQGRTVYDPFCGAGTIAYEAWAAGRNVIANDLSPYATVLTRSKLFPYRSPDDAMVELNAVAAEAPALTQTVDLSTVPEWVRGFFHPQTLREIIAWVGVLQGRQSHFLLSCLLGILHHQRPGFLSYPSSHTVPYLREKNFPRDAYPELYQYRAVGERLERKVKRAFRRVPDLSFCLNRQCHTESADQLIPSRHVDAIITSPPYMRQLDYARDNRLRLWFLGAPDWKSLDKTISPREEPFLELLRSCLKLWHNVIVPGGLCVLVLGDTYSRLYNAPLPDTVAHIATRETGGYRILGGHTERIPTDRRVRRGYCGSLSETVLVLRNEAGR